MSKWFSDRRVRTAGLILGSALALLLVFCLGVLIGVRAIRPLGFPLLEQFLRFQRGHGAVGTVTSIKGNSITMTGRDGQTQTVTVGSGTGIQIGPKRHAAVTDIHVGDTIVVIGSPGQNSIQARFIRVVHPPAITPTPLLVPAGHHITRIAAEN